MAAAVRLFARIRKHYNVDLPLATLFQAPTLAALAALVAQHANIPLAEEEPGSANTATSSAPASVTSSWEPRGVTLSALGEAPKPSLRVEAVTVGLGESLHRLDRARGGGVAPGRQAGPELLDVVLDTPEGGRHPPLADHRHPQAGHRRAPVIAPASS